MNYPIYEAPNLLEQKHFPASKKKRIRKKWAKRPDNWWPMRKCIFMNGAI